MMQTVCSSPGAVISDDGISVGEAAVVGQTGGGWQVGHTMGGGQEGQVSVGHSVGASVVGQVGGGGQVTDGSVTRVDFTNMS